MRPQHPIFLLVGTDHIRVVHEEAIVLPLDVGEVIVIGRFKEDEGARQSGVGIRVSEHDLKPKEREIGASA
ncbi:hypothetical protein SFR_1734 [Streptomyces sp. FR-008]|nr:hypothetical protein SFR_1734 [Streptomyces sp. FR-008]